MNRARIFAVWGWIAAAVYAGAVTLDCALLHHDWLGATLSLASGAGCVWLAFTAARLEPET